MRSLFVLLVTAMLFLTSCKKEEEKQPETPTYPSTKTYAGIRYSSADCNNGEPISRSTGEANFVRATECYLVAPDSIAFTSTHAHASPTNLSCDYKQDTLTFFGNLER